MSHASQPRIHTADESGIAAAVRILREGGLVAVPTETVYGLAARADDPDAVSSIYRAKGRPSFNPLIVHVGDVEVGERYARFDARARALAEAFWPGPLTMVLPLKADAGLVPAVTAGLPTVALRSPAHPVMQSLIARSGLPLAAPSANRSGGVSPTTAEHVAASLGSAVDLVLDAGPCVAGVESTIVALRENGGWQLLRPGPITEAQIEEVLGIPGHKSGHGAIEAPGQLVSHYAPGKPVRLDVLRAEESEFHIGFGPVSGNVSLSESGDLTEAAARLYALLHRAAAAEQPRIAVAPVPDVGLGRAINDRLRRAAA